MRQEAKRIVWIDTDPSVAPGGREIDDGLALIQAFNSPELEIRGVSIVFGNAPLEQTWPIGREIVRRFGPPGLEVYPGAAEAGRPGEETAATRALAAALKVEPLTIIALGPVTNVATVVGNHPELIGNIEEIIVVAGRRPGQRFQSRSGQPRSFPDLNFELDAPGFRVLLDSNVPLVLTPWEISSKVWLTETEVEAMARGNEATKWLHQPAVDWLKWWRETLGLEGFNPFDTLAVGYLTSPALIAWEDLPVEIRLLPDDVNEDKDAEGAAVKPYLLVGRDLGSARRVRYCYDVAPQFRDDLMARLVKQNNRDVEVREHRSGRLRLMALLAVMVVVIALARSFNVGERIEELRGWIESLGAWGPVVFVLIYIVAVVAALPGSALTIIAGALFGSLPGIIIVSIGATCGASLAFLISRYFARNAVAGWLGRNEKFQRLDRLTERHGAAIVALTRLVPVFPFNLLNYGFGLTRVPFRTYVFWSWLCMLPGTVLYVVGADALTKAVAQRSTPWTLVGAATAAAVILALLVRAARRRLIERETEATESKPDDDGTGKENTEHTESTEFTEKMDMFP